MYLLFDKEKNPVNVFQTYFLRLFVALFSYFLQILLFSYWLEFNVAGVEVFFEFPEGRAMPGAPDPRRLQVLHKVGEVVVTENYILLLMLQGYILCILIIFSPPPLLRFNFFPDK